MSAGRAAQRGSVVLVALCLVTVLSVAVFGYFAVCMRTMELSNRSFCYTSSVQLAELGMEEALWALDQALNTSGYSWSGWTLATVNGVPTATKTLTGFLTNQGLQGSVNLSVTYYNTTTPYTQPPTITSDGIQQLPDGTQIDKQLKAIVKPAALFSNAMGSTAPAGSPSLSAGFPYAYVSFVSNGFVTVDSYDSTKNSGNYTSSPSKVNRSDQAILSGPYISFDNARVLGYATTSNPTASLPTFNGGTLKSFTTPGLTSIDYSLISNNGGQRMFDIAVPPQVTLLPTSGSVGPGSYYYTASNCQINSTLTITGPATIYAPFGFEINVYGQVIISSSSTGPVQFYVGNWFYVDNGSTGVVNQTKNPAYLAIYASAAGCYGWLAQSAPFYGVVYMPNSIVYLLYGGSFGNVTFYGSIVGNEVCCYNCWNSLNFHYDLNLRNTTFSLINTPYEVTQWLEN